MWADMMKLIADDGEVEKYTEMEDTGFGYFSVADGENIRLTSFKIFGNEPGEDIPCIGYYETDGSFRLNVRVHGETFFDGHELVRLMRASGAEVLGEDPDDEHFLYLSRTDRESVVVSTDYLMPPTWKLYIGMTATLAEDIKNGGALKPGLHYSYELLSPKPIAAATSGVGDVKLTCTTQTGYRTAGLIHKPTEEYMELPIRYDSVYMTESKKAEPMPYDGRTVSFDIGKPLLYVRGICDELECVSGRITRRVGTLVIDESMPVEAVTLNYINCYRLTLPFEIGMYGSILDFYTGDMYELEEYDYSLYIDPSGRWIYFQVFDTDLEGAKEAIMGQELTYALAEEEVTELGYGIGSIMPSGKSYVEICSPAVPEFCINYKRKE